MATNIKISKVTQNDENGPGVTREYFKFSLAFTSEAKASDGKYYNSKRIVETYSLNVYQNEELIASYTPVSTNEKFNQAYSINYTLAQGDLEELETQEFQIEFTYKKITYTWVWDEGTSSTGSWTLYPEEGETLEPALKPTKKIVKKINDRMSVPKYDIEGNLMYYETWYTIKTTTYGLIEEKTATEEASETSTINFYPYPDAFKFIDCESGNTWIISDGINSLIKNIKIFANYATQWKAAKTQNGTIGSCPQFDSPISAEQLNNIYTYVEKTGGYKAGDKVSAAMFNNLASAINSG